MTRAARRLLPISDGEGDRPKPKAKEGGGAPAQHPRYRHPAASRVFAAQTGGPSGAEGDLFRQGVRDSVALSRAAGFRVSLRSPGMTKAEAATLRPQSTNP